MAYLRDLQPYKCAQCRTKNATVQLITRYNEGLAAYCRPCGEKKCRELAAGELAAARLVAGEKP